MSIFRQATLESYWRHRLDAEVGPFAVHLWGLENILVTPEDDLNGILPTA